MRKQGQGVPLIKTMIVEKDLILNFHNRNFSKNILFIHGGPGLTSNGFEEYYKKFPTQYNELKANTFFYNQKGCKAEMGNVNITHQDNVSDLDKILKYLKEKNVTTTIVSHSYGCLIAYDSLSQNKGYDNIFISPSSCLFTPFMNKAQSLLLLMKVLNPEKYMDLINYLPDSDPIWSFTKKYEKILNIQHELHMWANLDKMKTYTADLTPINSSIFNSVSKSIDVLNKEQNILNFENISIKYKIFLGAQDIQMGVSSFFNDANAIYFNKSSHYPHIEEEKRFCNEVNAFLY